MFPGFRIFIFTVLLFLTSAEGFCTSPQDTLWNQTDDKGWKQGYWKKHYPNGELLYRGFFIDDKPSERMERFYDNGKIRARLDYSKDPGTTYATMYFKNGQPGAEGKYSNQARDSIWNFYSYYTATLSYQETYRMGKKEGPSKKFYPEGTKAELIYWEDDMKNGTWEQFYENSTLRLSSSYKMDQINGPYQIYNRDHILILNGSYKKGKMDGDWEFFDDQGNLYRVLSYLNGEILNEEELEKWAQDFIDKVEKDLGKIPEPDLNNFFERTP